jgi:hypothetical protein
MRHDSIPGNSKRFRCIEMSEMKKIIREGNYTVPRECLRRRVGAHWETSWGEMQGVDVSLASASRDLYKCRRLTSSIWNGWASRASSELEHFLHCCAEHY